MDEWDTLHSTSTPDLHWTTSNLGEAMPGVLTPLSWSMWAAAIERAPREAAYRIGALTDAERRVAPRVDDRATRIFFGRPAMQVEFFALLGDRMPGTTGRETVRSVFGRVPEDMTFAPTRRPVPALRRPIAATRIPLRGVVKRSFLQAFDLGRACACRLGDLLHAEGVVDMPEDVFYLTVEELAERPPGDPKELVAKRRERREAYRRLAILQEWTGRPTAEALSCVERDSRADQVISGVGVSSGIVEGTVRIVLSPDDEDIEPDEILVAPFTDPSWSSLLFISAGLVVDIGGALSHAAVVARELEIPCVVNTRTVTIALRTGDRVRIDGGTGTVELLKPAS